MPDFSRRVFVRTTAASAAALMAGPAALAARRKKLPIGVQLYSVGKEAAADLPGTLAAIKKMGYDGVEFAGYYGKDAKTLRKLLDDNGLKACGSHTGLRTMVGDELPKTIEFNQILGNRFLVAPSLPKENTSSLEAWAKTAAVFDEIAKRLKPHKMHVGYHNHTAEFQSLEGQVPLEFFFSKTNKAVFMQLDIGHWARAGGDPVAMLKKFRGRALTVHVKDFNPTNRGALIGEGQVKWPEVFAACERGGTQWYIIEEEGRAYPGLEGIERSVRNLKKLLA
jgi:sugar phosphate isomerase/epimerase